MVVCPAPLADEIATGYKGRIIRFNGWSSETEAMRFLLSWLCKEKTYQKSNLARLQLLAVVAGMEIAEFVRKHTVLPLLRAVAGKLPIVPHGSLERPTLLWTHAMRELRSGAYFCLQCVDDDSEKFGVPYWHRQHQLPGLYWCPWHKASLSWVETSHTFLSSPTNYLDSHYRIPGQWADAIRNDPFVNRFIDICLLFFDRAQPLDELNLGRAALVRAAELGLHSGHGEITKPLLSDLINQRFPSKWLNSIVPGLPAKKTGEYWRAVDAAVRSGRPGVSATIYALIFSALYDSDEQAIGAVLSSSYATNKPRATPIIKCSVSDASLREAYVENSGNMLAVAKQLRMNQYRVIKRLSGLGLPRLGKLRTDNLSSVIDAVLMNDASLSAACEAFGLPQEKVREALRAALKPLNTALNQMRVNKEPLKNPPGNRRRPTKSISAIFGVDPSLAKETKKIE